MNHGLRFVCLSLAASAAVWALNFRKHSASEPELQELNSAVVLSLSPGRRHVLVTGGAGYIGSHAALQLIEQGHTVTVVDNLSRGNAGALYKIASLVPEDRFKFFNIDLGSPHQLVGIMRDARPPIDLVMHFAAVAYVGESMKKPLMYYSNISFNTFHVLESMKAAGVRQLVYSSTCAVYGNPPELPVTETTPTQPINPYGAAKLVAEDMVRSFAHAVPGFQAILLRYFNVYGSDPAGRLGEYPRADLRVHARISGACLDAALGNVEHLTIKGTNHPTADGTCVRDYIHVTDLVNAHLQAMERTANPPALYNIATGKGVSVQQFVDACLKVTGKDIKVVKQAEARPGDYAEVYANPAKIFQDFGWRPNYTNVEDGLRHAWAWRQSNPNGYI